MAKARLSMRKIRDVLRLKFDCALSGHQIAHSCQISRSTSPGSGIRIDLFCCGLTLQS